MRPLLLSASQIQLFTECQRKWGFRYIDRIQTPQHPSALLGTEVHEQQLGPYLTRGQSFDFTRPSGEIANALVPLLPAPQTPGVQLERHFVLPSPSGGFSYQGYIDLFAPDSGCVPGLEGGRPLCGDFKTTGNLQYAKDADALATDIQAQLYAWALMREERVSELDLVWFYTRTKGARKAQRTHLRVYQPSVDDQFARIDAIGESIFWIRESGVSAKDLPPNALMCDQYGGCPFRNRCNLAPPVFAAAVNDEAMKEKDMNNDFLAKLRKQTEVTNGTPPFQQVSQTPPRTTLLSDVRTEYELKQAAAFEAPLPAINPPESALPPAPPVGVAALEPKRRSPRAKGEFTMGGLDYQPLLEKLVASMKELGVRKIVLDVGLIKEIELG